MVVALRNSTSRLRLLFLPIFCQVRDRQDHVVSVPLGDGMLGDPAMACRSQSFQQKQWEQVRRCSLNTEHSFWTVDLCLHIIFPYVLCNNPINLGSSKALVKLSRYACTVCTKLQVLPFVHSPTSSRALQRGGLAVRIGCYGKPVDILCIFYTHTHTHIYIYTRPCMYTLCV